jgi:hypothetical protein
MLSLHLFPTGVVPPDIVSLRGVYAVPAGRERDAFQIPYPNGVLHFLRPLFSAGAEPGRIMP